MPGLYAAWELVSALLLAPWVGGLGAADWHDREAAAEALAAAGFFAYPALVAATGNPDPEVRMRAARLLSPLESGLGDLTAAGYLMGLLEPLDPIRLGCDDRTRRHLYRVAVRLGCPDRHWYAGRLLPENDGDPAWWRFDEGVTGGLSACREFLRGRPSVPDDYDDP